MSVIERIESLFLWRGRQSLDSDADVPITALQYMRATHWRRRVSASMHL